MLKNSSVAHQRTYTLKDIISGVILGGLVGILVGFLHSTSILIIPGLNTVFSAIPVNEIISGALLGIILGGLMGGAWILYSTENINAEYVPETRTTKQSINDDSKNVTLQIKEEQLDIAKKWVKTGDVKIYKENFTEEKSFTVPVMHEELIIEKKTLASDRPEHKDAPTEVIRIPLSEEQVEFTKYRVTLEDVSIYKQHIEDIKHIEATLKRDEAKVKVSGSPRVRDKSNSSKTK
ncbi:uncharacterized protein (TIGR02271 family) [Anaerosolibacter carboniphilus]|uniref:Uncharacterized protein (TIGR02271 family) n=1 Tax=Anaerosolibacter carboniphilus TaxID=1417629 RepID=A0A841L2F4_9FIRM|nr:YsnF/AvaK domain-containing protein [Anaerosolibacter carboniphilus]MBB6216569.1 uncharacterized protein (TIGR02271 family) [Anaerosolibacter carboniphilus]